MAPAGEWGTAAISEGGDTVEEVISIVDALRTIQDSDSGACVDKPALAAAESLDAAWQARHGGLVPERTVNAARFAARAHTGQRRRSGELYISHPISVAAAVAAAGFDAPSIEAALCHDVIEDCDVTLTELMSVVGEEVAQLVDGVSKVDKVHFPSASEATAASMTKFLVAVIDDVRVLAIKLADRLHNLRTAGALRVERRERLAAEALEVFSPLAHRLGMEELRREMEDLAFELAEPDAYMAVASLVAQIAPEADRIGSMVAGTLRDQLAHLSPAAQVTHRVKHLYSIHNKLCRDTVDGALHDIVGVRVVVGTVADCYAALGVVHSNFAPKPGRFKDMIAVPKSNGYQSLHTTVRVDGHDTEIQIRTREMHARAQFGVAAHYTYKETWGASSAAGRGRDQGLADAWSQSTSPEEFLELLREELAPESEVVVLTPHGKPVVLPAGSCAIDFAYKIHTEIGHCCVGAKADGKLLPIRQELWTGPVVEIVTSNTPNPKRDWLRVCRTPQARARIRKFLDDSVGGVDQTQAGADILAGELRRRGVDPAALTDDTYTERIARLNNVSGIDLLYVKLANGRLRPGSVRGLPAVPAGDVAQQRERSDAAASVLSNLPFTVARCCKPTADDESAGFVSAARIVSVHKVDCPNYLALVRSLPADSIGRLLPVGPGAERRAWVEVHALDRPGLLRDLSAATADLGVNIGVAATRSEGAQVVGRFEFEIADDDHLAVVCDALRTVKSVTRVSSSN